MIEINGIDLHWETVGEGEPLLWLHGFMGSGSDWRFAFGDPPAGFQVIAPDLRGHGSSTNPSGAFTFRQAALDVRGLLDYLGLDRVKAVGLSGGGIVLLHIATADPASIESMVLVSAPPFFPEQARVIQRQFTPAALPSAEVVRMRERHPQGDRQIDQLFAQARGFADSFDDVNFTPPYLSRITADTLVVFGDRDPFYPVDLAFDLHAAIRNSHLWVVPNGGHGPIFGDAAPEFRRIALSFLRGQWRAGAAGFSA